ncbi:SRPBCC family protein [Devosia oryziradicis]|uniref:SRPBCC family protein n=1 Tax=Devosia oryziradicis TaxID=2801335 RepID=A0ABX7BW93_9HYPH|nr:SRPBCC family protein [Devosia oryziradicis]QQR34690.1 SRPBCC family protein [Devosia oryziradicis]
MVFGDPLTVTTPTDTQIVITRHFDAPRHLVFACYTQPALIRRWLNGAEGWIMTVCEFDARVGGRYRYEWKAPDGYVMGMGGVVTAFEPVSHVASAELFDDDWTGGETVSKLDFDETSGRTTLVNTITYASKDARDGALKTPMAEGMEFGYKKLDTVLAELKQE